MHPVVVVKPDPGWPGFAEPLQDPAPGERDGPATLEDLVEEKVDENMEEGDKDEDEEDEESDSDEDEDGGGDVIPNVRAIQWPIQRAF